MARRKVEVRETRYIYKSGIVKEIDCVYPNQIEQTIWVIDESVFNKMLSLFKNKIALDRDYTKSVIPDDPYIKCSECTREFNYKIAWKKVNCPFCDKAHSNPLSRKEQRAFKKRDEQRQRNLHLIWSRYQKKDKEFEEKFGDFYKDFVKRLPAKEGQVQYSFNYNIVSREPKSYKLLKKLEFEILAEYTDLIKPPRGLQNYTRQARDIMRGKLAKYKKMYVHCNEVKMYDYIRISYNKNFPNLKKQLVAKWGDSSECKNALNVIDLRAVTHLTYSNDNVNEKIRQEIIKHKQRLK